MAELVLIVEDESHVRELVSFALQGAGYRVRAVGDGESALREAALSEPDVVVLDVRLPGIDGWEVCRRLRERTSVPILMLTALGDDEHHVRGLRLGADDYMAKPFSPAVLSARVHALLRRSTAGVAQGIVRLRGLTIDLDTSEVRRAREVVHLTATEFRFLATLARRPGQVISPRELVRAVQGYDLKDREAQEIVKVHIRHVRRKIELEADRPRYIVTVRGLGYMLNREELETEEPR